MTVTEILPDLFFIQRGYLNANHFVYRAASPVLIDSGYLEDFDETERLLNHIGVKIKDVGRIITTHCHCDHIGGHHRIQQASGCDIVLHPLGKHFMDTRDDWSTWWKYYHQKADFFTGTQGLEDGDTLSVGPYQFEVIHTPGHAADGIVLYNRKHQVLISSDTLWEHDMAVHTLRVEGSATLYQTRKSLERLSVLDVATVYPGHGGGFTDFAGAMARGLQRVKRFQADGILVGNDVLKKIMVYTILMHTKISVERFFDMLMKTHWYCETVDLYFKGNYRRKYEETIRYLTAKGIVAKSDGGYVTSIRP